MTLKIEYLERVKNRADSTSLNLKYNPYKAFVEKKTELYVINDSSFYTYNEFKAKKKLFSKILLKKSRDNNIHRIGMGHRPHVAQRFERHHFNAR